MRSHRVMAGWLTSLPVHSTNSSLDSRGCSALRHSYSARAATYITYVQGQQQQQQHQQWSLLIQRSTARVVTFSPAATAVVTTAGSSRSCHSRLQLAITTRHHRLSYQLVITTCHNTRPTCGKGVEDLCILHHHGHTLLHKRGLAGLDHMHGVWGQQQQLGLGFSAAPTSVR